jgi:hypothetical protein
MACMSNNKIDRIIAMNHSSHSTTPIESIRQSKIDRILTIFEWQRDDLEAYQLLEELRDMYSDKLNTWSNKEIDDEYENLENEREMMGMEEFDG